MSTVRRSNISTLDTSLQVTPVTSRSEYATPVHNISKYSNKVNNKKISHGTLLYLQSRYKMYPFKYIQILRFNYIYWFLV